MALCRESLAEASADSQDKSTNLSNISYQLRYLREQKEEVDEELRVKHEALVKATAELSALRGNYDNVSN